MVLKDSAWQKARKVTSLFEGGSVTGSYDGMGVSMGLLQWNLGMGTLNPILRKFFNTYPTLTREWGLIELETAINNGISAALNFAKNTMNGGGTSLVKPWSTRLIKLNNSQEFQDITKPYCDYYINKAISLCNSYGLTSDRAFSLFFDICVQQGSIPVKTLSATTYIGKLDEIALYAASRANTKWQTDVRNRKRAIVYGMNYGRGWDSTVVFDDLSAFEEDFSIVLQKFTNKKIITDMDYWLNNCKEGSNINGNYVKIVIQRFVSMFKIFSTNQEIFNYLQEIGIVNSPDYWIAHASNGQICNGAYVKQLLINMSSKF